MKILSLKVVEHSGQGDNAIHKKVIAEFNKSTDQGMSYCEKNNLVVNLTETLLEVRSNDMYGFKMIATISK